MRTTLTLEPDVATEIKRIRREDDRSFKEVINEILRIGLRARSQKGAGRRKKPFRTPTADLGKPLIDLDNVAEALAIAEGEDYR